MSSPANSTTNLVSSSPANSSSSVPNKDFSAAFATLQSSYGFGGSAPVLPHCAEHKKPRATSNVPSQSRMMHNPSLSGGQKDYDRQFGELQAVYGLGAGYAPTSAIRSKNTGA